MASPIIERLTAPITDRLRGWLATRAQRAELHALPPAERASLLRELGMTPGSIDRLVANHPGPATLLPKRLDEVGLDAGYLSKTQPAAFRDLQRVCSTCPDWKMCRVDIDRADAVERVSAYCPNTHTIDSLLIGRDARPRP